MCLIGLSFNSIEKIEGLESLQKLKVLDLTNNQISVIENLDALENLSSLYIGNNCLEQLDNVTQFFLHKLPYQILHLTVKFHNTTLENAYIIQTECIS